jgi:hypothetical protein
MGFHVEAPTGRATLEELFALVDRLDAIAAADPEARILLDETAFENAGIGTDEVRQVGVRWLETAHAQHVRIAVVAPDSTMFGMSRMGVVYAEAEEKIRVFRDRAAAEAWLRL